VETKKRKPGDYLQKHFAASGRVGGLGNQAEDDKLFSRFEFHRVS